MYNLPENQEWYNNLASLEAANEVSAGFIDPKLDGACNQKTDQQQPGYSHAEMKCMESEDRPYGAKPK